MTLGNSPTAMTCRALQEAVRFALRHLRAQRVPSPNP